MIRIVTENLGLKLLSLGVATLLWLAAVGDPESTMGVVIPVQYHNVPSGLEVSSDFVESAYVEVSGPRGRLSTAGLGSAVVVIDLRPVNRPAERTFSILSGNLNLPPGVEFLRAVPSQVRVRLETRVSRDVPIIVRFGSAMPEGYRIVGQEISPSTARIVGPESRANAVDRVQTDPIDLVGVPDEHLTFRVHVFSGDDHIRLEPSDLLVTVKVNLEKSDR